MVPEGYTACSSVYTPPEATSLGDDAAGIALYERAFARTAPFDRQIAFPFLHSLGPGERRTGLIAGLDAAVRETETLDAARQWIGLLLALNEYQAAARTAEWVCTTKCAGSADYRRWGYALMQLGDRETAVRKTLEALKLDPNDRAALSLLVRALKGLEDRVGLLAELGAVVAARSDSGVNQAWGVVLNRVGLHREVARHFEKNAPTNAAGYLEWGWALATLGEHENALANYEGALARNPVEPDLLFTRLAASLRALGTPLGAVERLQAQIDRLDRVDVLLAWGKLLDDLGNLERAVAQYRRAGAKGAADANALRRWGDALVKLGRHDEALDPYIQAMAKSPGAPELAGLARALTHVDAEDEATANVQRTVDDINGGRVYRVWGDVLAGLARPAEALLQYEKCRTKGFVDTDLEIKQGGVLVGLERFGEAVALYRQALPKATNASDVHIRLGNAYLSHHKFDQAMRHYREAERNEDLAVSMPASFNVALTLDRLRRTEDAIAKYQSLIDKCATVLSRGEGNTVKAGDKATARHFLPYANHNLADILDRYGEYTASRPAWQATANAYRQYNADIAEEYNADIAEADADHLMYAADLLREIDQEFETAEQLLRRGLELNPKHTGILAGLVKTLLAKRDQALPTAEGDPRSRAHRNAWDAYRKAEQILSGRIDRAETGALWLELGMLHASIGENDRALAALQKAVTRNPGEAEAYQSLGAICLRMEDAKTAIGHFKAALDRAPGNLATCSRLAEAYLKHNLVEKAEAEYKKVLTIAPTHFDSLLGLGKVYVTMGETQVSRDRKADAEGMFLKSFECLSEAIKRHTANTGSRKLSKTELASAHYSCGYSLVMRYETQTLVKQNESLLQAARQNFAMIPESDVNYHKAQRAILKIDERLKPPRLLAEQWGARLVLTAAILMFVSGLVALVVGRPVWGSGFVVTETALAELKKKGAPDDLVKKLKPLEDRHLPDQGRLTEELRKVGGEDAAKFSGQLATSSAVGTGIRGVQPVETGYAVLLMFGSVIFMVAGLYLQQISKLKFGGLELEKSSGEQVKVATSLGISM